jgi:hypothetical protein
MISDSDLDSLSYPAAQSQTPAIAESSNPPKRSLDEVSILLRALGPRSEAVDAQSCFLGEESTDQLFVSSRRRLRYVAQIHQKLQKYQYKNNGNDADSASRAAVRSQKSANTFEFCIEIFTVIVIKTMHYF